MQSHLYNQDLIDSIFDPVIIVNRDRLISMVNDAFLIMQGATREQVIGKTCFSVLHHQQSRCRLPMDICPYEEVFEMGRSATVTHRHFTNSGAEIICELTASPVRDRNGRIMHMIEVIRDVSEGRRLQEETRQSAHFLSSVLEGIGEGVVVMDLDYRILTANKGYLNQVGKKREDVIGRHCYEVSHHFDSHCMHNGHDCPVRIVFETAAPAHAIHTHYDDKKEEVYVECHAYPIRDASGKILRAIETLNDVTGRVKLEQKLKESEEKYRDLYDNAPDGYYSLSDTGRIKEVNRTFLEMLGYSREEVVGRAFIDDLLSEESVATCRTKFPELKRSGRMCNIELAIRKKDRSFLPVTMNASAVYDSSGKFIMSRSVIRDITDRKKADEEKRKLQEQLFQSQKLEALGTLAGGIAHDFNNLLASILGYSSLAKADLSPNDPVHQHVSIIETASLRASELTQQLLAFARGGKYDPKPNDINTIVREVSALLSRTIEKNISIEVVPGEGLRPALCDAGQVQQAILNICINGRDAMPGGGTLMIKTENMDLDINDVQFYVDISPGHFIRVTVSDTGTGMDRETREQIFDPFFTTKEKGTGLGLSLVYGIIKKHDGFIQVKSKPGQGSQFMVYLPACVTEEVCSGKREPVDLRRGSELVLVVDDEPMITDLAREILLRYGYSVLTAAGGDEAIGIYERRSGEIAAVILDMIMPGLDGRAVFRRLREMDPDVKVIASSGYSHDRDADDLLKQGAAGFVQKPYRISELIRVVGRALERRA